MKSFWKQVGKEKKKKEEELLLQIVPIYFFFKCFKSWSEEGKRLVVFWLSNIVLIKTLPSRFQTRSA